MQDSPKNGINWLTFFFSQCLSLLLLLVVFCSFNLTNLPAAPSGVFSQNFRFLAERWPIYLTILAAILVVGLVGCIFYFLLRTLGLFFVSFLLLVPSTWYVVHGITPENMPINASGQGGDVDQLIVYVHILMGLLFVGWIGYFFYVIMRFHKSNNPKADYVGVKSHASTYVEGIVAVFEAVLLIGFAIPVWSRAVDKFPSEKDSTVIKVIAQQFQWHGWYPGPHGKFAANDEKFFSSDNPYGLDQKDPNYKENFFVASDLVVPVDKPVLVYISSMDVIHCFACKPMRVTQDAIPGMVFPAHFTPKKLGTYQINCAQLCGQGHYTMKGTIKVVPQADYDKWVAKNSKAGGGGGGGFE